MPLHSDAEFVRLLNQILIDPNPFNRVEFAHELSTGFGRMFMLPTAGLEQLINKLQSEHDDIEKNGAFPFPKEMVDEGLAGARITIATLRIFLRHRAAMVQELNEAFPQDVRLIPD